MQIQFIVASLAAVALLPAGESTFIPTIPSFGAPGIIMKPVNFIHQKGQEIIEARIEEYKATCALATTEAMCSSAQAPIYCKWQGGKCAMSEWGRRPKCAMFKDSLSCTQSSIYCKWDDDECEHGVNESVARQTARERCSAVPEAHQQQCKHSYVLDCKFIHGQRQCFV